MPKRHRPGVSATSVLRHLEEVILATSGEDAFEIVFAVAAARIAESRETPLRRAIASVARRYPMLEVDPVHGAPDELLERVDALLSSSPEWAPTLDAVFESLVPRVAKSDKGQFFTPRHVVDFIVRALAPTRHEVVIDPACGSGAFLSHARAFAMPGNGKANGSAVEQRLRGARSGTRARAERTARSDKSAIAPASALGCDVDLRAPASALGCDVDLRAVRVARLLALAGSADPATIRRADGLRAFDLPEADVVATNPPFAGRAPAEGFEVARVVRTPERDVLFLERALSLLRPGGRLGIVLPYNKASGEAFAGLRRWLVDRARVLAIVGLPRETFLPHTSQRTFVLFAQKRMHPARPTERTMLMVSERAGKDSGGEPILRDGRPDHDLEDVAAELTPFLRAEGFA